MNMIWYLRVGEDWDYPCVPLLSRPIDISGFMKSEMVKFEMVRL